MRKKVYLPHDATWGGTNLLRWGLYYRSPPKPRYLWKLWPACFALAPFGVINVLSNFLGALWNVVAFNPQFTPLPTTTIESDEIVIAHGGNRRRSRSWGAVLKISNHQTFYIWPTPSPHKVCTQNVGC